MERTWWIGFVFYNKTSENIYLHLDECFFVENNIAYDYYGNRIWSSNSVSVAEKNIICIPPQTGKIVTEYDIVTDPYRSCDLYRNPKKKEPHSVTFDKDNSPFVFGNRIAFSIGESEVLVRVNNDFYVSMISNYPEQDVVDIKSSEMCGKKDGGLIRVFKETSPDQFYIMYNLTGSMGESRY